MGLFNRRKKQEEMPQMVVKDEPQNCMKISRAMTSEYGEQIIAEYYEDDADFKKFYDTTKLVINPTPININGVPVYYAQVSWYGQTDAIYFGPNGEEMGRRSDMTNIKLEIDMNKLCTDPQYQEVLMLGLLDKKRVERYMQMGLEEESKQPCGDYIGGVALSDKTMQYAKMFRTYVGQAVHSSPEMVAKRQRYQENRRMAKEKMKREKQAQIERLQREIDEL